MSQSSNQGAAIRSRGLPKSPLPTGRSSRGPGRAPRSLSLQPVSAGPTQAICRLRPSQTPDRTQHPPHRPTPGIAAPPPLAPLGITSKGLSRAPLPPSLPPVGCRPTPAALTSQPQGPRRCLFDRSAHSATWLLDPPLVLLQCQWDSLPGAPSGHPVSYLHVWALQAHLGRAPPPAPHKHTIDPSSWTRRTSASRTIGHSFRSDDADQ
ncbi:hypothetical protein NDU88_005134 [Pleurodeles waltl]|uniref:Uncharacterized protein n=1 Tax=Pleurodeles waltl TaxID=8319 RepID=A0AAV7MB86_PLEWA|nr:hypothetical protein NDU88_005134 [Pleurodeles waltl]